MEKILIKSKPVYLEGFPNMLSELEASFVTTYQRSLLLSRMFIR